ncbi:acetyl-CoA synthetase-like protein, partial [Gymnopus androsaceus JB14]
IIHHIATDGWSEGIIDEELAIFYNTLCAGLPIPLLPHLPVRYTDYSVWQNKRLESGVLETQLGYWYKQLEGSKPLELHAEFIRPERLSSQAAEIPFEISTESVTRINQLAATHRTSLYVVLLAAFRAALFRITGEEDGCIGMVNANRPQEELEHIVGFFVNTHAIRLSIDAETNFEDMVLQTRRVTAEALQNSEVPFDKVVQKCLTAQRELSRNPLVQLMFVLQDFSGVVATDSSNGLCGLKYEEIRNASTRLDMTIHLFVRGGGLRGYVMYQTDLFTSGNIQAVIDVFQRIIVTATAQPSVPISTLVLSTSFDLKMLENWNSTNQYSAGGSLHDRFRAVASLEGSSLAVVDGSSSLTYSELDEQTDRLASWLVGRGLNAEEAVGIWMGRSVLLVVAYLGCLKAGLAFMPLDYRLPVDRLRLMVQSAKCRLMLTSGDGPLCGEIHSIDLAQEMQIMLSTPIVTLPVVSAHQLSNIVYTSGSTGAPKAVMIEHRGMVNLCAPETTNWPGKLNTALATSIGFDPSGFQIFSALLGGSTLYCLTNNIHFDAQEYQAFLIKYSIHRCYMTPSVLAALLETGDDWLERSSLKHIMLGGEKLNPSKVSECLRRLPTLEFFSSYGPAEASVRSAYFPITSVKNLQKIPLGRALPNTSIYILDNSLYPVPAGVIGEICVSGVHVSRGYLHQPELTARHFIETAQDSPLGSRRIYCTGDLGYWTKEGLVQFIGRKDTQLKLLGQRIEAGEVEFAINHHPSVQSSAVAIVRSKDDGEQLVAYVQLGQNGSLKEEGVLSLWEDLYNEEESYTVLDNNDAGHDFARWFSMFNGERIPLSEMQEWLEDTISHIPHAASDRCLEVGVGTGMIALNLINEVSSYVGVDVSAPSLDFLDTQIKRLDLSSKISIMQAAAHELDLIPKHRFSLVVFNSVLQYFPSADYLTDVIGKVIEVMASTGRIFIGDVRSHALIPYHDVERMLASIEHDADIEDGRIIMQRYEEVQTELLLSPAFFYQLQKQFPEIAHVEIKPKLMKARNELSRYRYTVILHIGTPPMLITPKHWVDFADIGSTADIRSELRKRQCESGDVIGVTHIPIADIQIISDVLDRIENLTNPVSDLRHRIAAQLVSTPAELKQIAREEGCEVILDYSSQGRHDNFLSAIFIPSAHSTEYLAGNFPRIPSLDHSEYPSHNAVAKKTADVAAVLHSLEKRLRKGLPAYMVPSRIINLEHLPLNASGKLDRKLLSSAPFFESCDLTISRSKKDVALASKTELEVLAIFSRALGCLQESIGIEDSLFNLGGHSLTATLVVSAVRRDLGVELSMARFFRDPTVKAVATVVDSTRSTTNGSDSQSHGAIPALLTLTDTIFNTSPDSSSPIVFIFPEATGIPSVYSTAFNSLSPYQVVAFGDLHWGQPLGPNESIESMAGVFVEEIRKIQPLGPYFLAGWSFGGYLALETAIQLDAAAASGGPESPHNNTKMVLMIDSSVYGAGDDSQSALGEGEASIRNERWKPAYDHLLTILDEKTQWLAQFDRANGMISRYRTRSKKYRGRVELIKALRGREQEPGSEDGTRVTIAHAAPIDDPTNGWDAILPQIKVHGFDASHRAMFSYENGSKMGVIIKEIFEGAEKED